MFKLLILVCSAGGDTAACTPDSALDVVRGPAVTMQQCLFGGQAQLAAAGGLLPKPGAQVVRIVCRPITDTTMTDTAR